jgi:hypothetical protein
MFVRIFAPSISRCGVSNIRLPFPAGGLCISGIVVVD